MERAKKEEVIKKIEDFFWDLPDDERSEEFNTDSSFEQLQLNEFDFIELIMRLEDNFSLAIDDQELGLTKATPNQLANHVVEQAKKPEFAQPPTN